MRYKPNLIGYVARYSPNRILYDDIVRVTAETLASEMCLEFERENYYAQCVETIQHTRVREWTMRAYTMAIGRARDCESTTYYASEIPALYSAGEYARSTWRVSVDIGGERYELERVPQNVLDAIASRTSERLRVAVSEVAKM